MDLELAKQLNLSGHRVKMTLHWFDDRETEENSMVVTCGIEGISTSCKRFELNGARPVTNLKLPYQSINSTELNDKYPHLRGLPYADYVDAQPKVLIGLNNAKLIKTLNTCIVSKH